jgi:DME family drug/metabolite transporter
VVNAGVTVSTVVALGLAPVLLTLAESISARRAPGTTRVLVLAAALGGLVLVSTAAGLSLTGPRPQLGILLAVASGATYAFATALGRPLTAVSSPLALATVTSCAGALGLLPLGLLAPGPHTSADPVVVGLLGYLGVMTLAVAYGLLYAGLRTVAGSAAVVATLLEPLTAAVLAAVVLGERTGVLGIVGGVLILLAVAGSAGNRPERRGR